MRVSHLTDIEIQEYLDQGRGVGTGLARSGEVAEHIQSCPKCRGELNTYRRLIGDLYQAPEIVELPRNFAKKVTLSLPPLAAARTRSRVQAALTGLAMVLTVLTVLVVMNLKLIATTASASLTAGYVTATTWLHSVFTLIPSLELSAVKSLTTHLTLQVVKEYLFRDHGSVNLFLAAAVMIILIASLEGLSPILPHRQRTR